MPLFLRQLWGDIRTAAKWRFDRIRTCLESLQLVLRFVPAIAVVVAMAASAAIAPVVAGLMLAGLFGESHIFGAAAALAGALAALFAAAVVVWVAGQ